MRTSKTDHKSEGLKLPRPLTQAWIDALRRFARAPRGVDVKELTDMEFVKLISRQESAIVRQLWEKFTVERADIGRYLLDPKKQNVAYLLGFHLPNVARTLMVLERFMARYPLNQQLAEAKFRVWDVGCGTGALSSAIVQWLLKGGVNPEAIRVELIDNKTAFLEAAETNLHNLAPDAQVFTNKWELKKGVNFRYEKDEIQVVALGYVWNELSRNEAAKQSLFKEVQRLLDQPSLVLVLEPANQHIAREAMELRDSWVDTGWDPLYPCPANTLCPMLNKPKDWCFSEGVWDRPLWVKDLDRRLEIDRSKINTAGYLFASAPFKKLYLKGNQKLRVVVGRPLKKDQKGFEYLICEGTKLTKEKGKPGFGRLWRGELFKA